MTNATIQLLLQVGKLAWCAGEDWRLDHPELMDAYESVCLELKTHIWIGGENNDTDSHKTKT